MTKETVFSYGMMLMTLELLAKEHSDGHLTVMRFTSGWRISLSTPSSREHIQTMIHGETFDEAFKNFTAFIHTAPEQTSN